MVELIMPNDWAVSPELRREVFAFRHRVFRERLAWEIRTHDALEFDEFDALLPLYMLARRADGHLLALWRLLPTTGPYMLRNTFPFLLEGRAAPRDPAVWEISRFAFDPPDNAGEGIWLFEATAGRMLCALCEYGLANGICEVLVVYDKPMALVLHRLGCVPRWVSRQHAIGATEAVAAAFAITPEALAGLRRHLAIRNSVLIPYQPERRAA
jgi:acyl homoserine lactone synthase